MFETLDHSSLEPNSCCNYSLSSFLIFNCPFFLTLFQDLHPGLNTTYWEDTMGTPLLWPIALLSLSSHVCWVLISAGGCALHACYSSYIRLPWLSCALLPPVFLAPWLRYCFSLCCPGVPTDLARITQSTPQYQSGLYLLHEDRRSHCLQCMWW